MAVFSLIKRRIIAKRDEIAIALYSGDAETAKKLALETLDEAESSLGKFHPETITVLLLTGQVEIANQDYARALEHLMDCRERVERGLFPGHPINITLMSILGQLYREQECFPESLHFYRTLVANFEESHRMGDVMYCTALGQLGNILRLEGDFPAAGEVYGKLLLQFSDSGFEDLDRSKEILGRLGAPSIVEYYDDQFLTLLDEALGYLTPESYADDELRSDIFLEYGNCLVELEDLDGALSQIERAMELKIALHGSSHPALIGVLRSLMILHRRANNLEQYERAEKFLFDLLEKTCGEDSIEVIEALRDAAYLREGQGDLGAVQSYLERALSKAESLKSSDPMRLAAIQHDLGLVLLNRNLTEEASPLIMKAFEARQAHYSSSHPEVAISLLALGALHRRTGDTSRAIMYFNRVAGMSGKTLEPESDLVKNALQQLMEIAQDPGTRGSNKE